MAITATGKNICKLVCGKKIRLFEGVDFESTNDCTSWLVIDGNAMQSSLDRNPLGDMRFGIATADLNIIAKLMELAKECHN